MGTKRIKTQYPGVYAKEHPTRKTRNGKKDKYYTIRYSRARRQTEECLGWASEGWSAQKAHALLCEIKQNIKSGDGPQTLEAKRIEQARKREEEQASKMTLDTAFFGYVLPMLQRQKASWLTDKQRYEKIVSPTLGECDTHKITTADIQSVIDYLVDIGLAPATVRQYRGLIHSIFERLRAVQVNGQPFFTGENPVRTVKSPPVVNARDRFLTATEAEQLIARSQGKRSPDLHDAIVLALNTGMRLGEIQRLKWQDVDLEYGFVNIKKDARRKPGGRIPLNAEAQKIFTARMARSEKQEGLVFPAQQGGAKRGNLTAAFKNLVEELGLNDGISPDDRARRIVFHSLRHTFASWLAMAGVDIYRIKDLMRHKTITMTMRYAHLIPDATRDAVNSLNPPPAHYNSGSSQEMPRSTSQSTSESLE